MAVWCALVGALSVALLLLRHSGEPGVKAVALASLAAVLGVVASRGLIRRLVCLLVAVLALVPLLSGRGALVLVGCALAVLGVGGAVVCRAWPQMGGRYDAPGTSGRRPADEGDLWSRIDQGDDPTV